MGMSVRGKMVVILSLVVILLSLALGIYSVRAMNGEIIGSAQEKLKSDLGMGRSLIDQRYPGDWSIKDAKLYKGETLMNDNFDIVDHIGAVTGDTVTIFQGDTRVATNVKKDGQRAVGTKVMDEVAQAVLKEGKTYIGKAQVVGTWNQTAYEPIKDGNGEIIGIWYVGVPNTIYDQMVADVRFRIILFGLAGVLVAVAVAWFFGSSLLKPISNLVGAMALAEKGDLSAKVTLTSQDELGKLAQSYNNMLENIAGLAAKVKEVAGHVQTSAAQLSTGAEQATRAVEQIANTTQGLASGTEKQARSISETSAIMAQMSAGVHQAATSSQAVATAPTSAADSAVQGGKAIEQAVSQMNAISRTVNNSAATIQVLGAQSQEIGKIVDVITGIADQTNLLALNAAIEAARAGEQGRGFAVVAEEVRKLAEQSAEAAKQISTLIMEIQTETDKAVKAMTSGTEEVKGGIEVVARAGSAFEEIVASVKDVSRQIAELSTSNQQMAAGAEQSVQAMENIATIAQETASSAQEVAAAAEEQMATNEEVAASSTTLAGMAEELLAMARKFTT